MSLQAIGLAALAAALTLANVVTTGSLWLSHLFEKPQKIAQTVMIWIVPGSFIVVRHFLREPSRSVDSSDPTVSRDSTSVDVTGDSHGHGGGGGHF